jgi:hypothetical protein
MESTKPRLEITNVRGRTSNNPGSEFPRTLAACQAAEQSQWAIGDNEKGRR